MVDSKKGGFIVKHPRGTNQVVVSNISLIFAPILGEIEMIQFYEYIILFKRVGSTTHYW